MVAGTRLGEAGILTHMQAAVGVVQKGLRPTIPPNTPIPLAAVMVACWSRDPAMRPSFEELRQQLDEILESTRADDMRRHNSGTNLVHLGHESRFITMF